MRFLTLVITLTFISCELLAYQIGPKDVIEIKVLEDSTLDKEVVVDSDGNISLPLLNTIPIKNLTAQEAEAFIKNKLVEDGYFVAPNVTVTIKQFESQKVLVLGEVNNPGSYSLKTEDSILDILTRAGGLKNDASRSLILLREQIFGKDNTETMTKHVNLDAIFSGTDMKENIVVKTNDILFVGKDKGVFVYGEVSRPGNLSYKPGLTALEAITSSGGFTSRANPVIKIHTTENGQTKIFKVDMRDVKAGTITDIKLSSSDLIYVDKSFF